MKVALHQQDHDPNSPNPHANQKLKQCCKEERGRGNGGKEERKGKGKV